MCAPETQPKIWTHIKTARPKLNTICSSFGAPFHGMQLEHPKNTSTAVPSNSLRNTETLSEWKMPFLDDFAISIDRSFN